MIGQTLTHYRIEGRLGEGGMGEVYSARDLRLDRSVALKVIRADIGDPILRDRFWREARAAAAFTHPALCHVYEIGEDQGRLFITMELLEGETLSLGRGPLTLSQTSFLGARAREAARAASGERRGAGERAASRGGDVGHRDSPGPPADAGAARGAAVPPAAHRRRARVQRAVEQGLANVPLFRRDPFLDPLRDDPRFQAALARAEEHHRSLVATYGRRLA